MKICYIYHSETGNTRGIVDRCLAATGGDRIEVHDLQNYSRISKYLVGARRAMKGLADPIEPSSIDASDYGLVVIGSPVWGGRPTPGINAAIQVLTGCEGKKGTLFVTCGGSPGERASP
jgi:flavodoxin